MLLDIFVDNGVADKVRFMGILEKLDTTMIVPEIELISLSTCTKGAITQ